MELVANIWPVVDQYTGVIQRYFIKAYAMDASDDEISNVLSTLAKTDYRTATLVAIPDEYVLNWDGNEQIGAVTINGFNDNFFRLIEDKLKLVEREFDHPMYSGFNSSGYPVFPEKICFPKNPYIVRTALLETSHGKLQVV